MTHAIEVIALWLTDFYLAATAILASAAAIFAITKQPARRIAVAWGVFFGLLIAAILCQSASRPRFDIRTFFVHHFSRPLPIAAIDPTPTPMSIESNDPAPGTSTSSDIIRSPRSNLPHVVLPPRDTAVQPIVVAPSEVHLVNQRPRPVIDGATIAAGVVIVFLVGAILMSARIAVGMWRALRLLRQSVPAPQPLCAHLQAIAGAPVRPSRLRVHESLMTPVATGAIWPTILLPRRLAEKFQGRELRAILAHEWAHVRNGDLWLLALDRCLLPVLWAHPLYWWLRRRLRQDQEFLVDGAASAAASGTEYAALLVALARELAGARQPSLGNAVGIWERPCSLAQRVSVLLNEGNRVKVRCSGRARAALAVCLGTFGILATTLSFRARIVEAAPRTPEVSLSQVQAERTPGEMLRVGDDEIGGMCRDGTLKPLAGVPVTLYFIDYRQNSQTVLQESTTNAAGQFKFRKVPILTAMDSGRRHYLLVARRDGHASSITRVRPGQWNNLEMPKSVSLTGTIKDQAGRPIGEALVSASSLPLHNLLSPIEGLRCARTDANGKFSIDDLGEYQYVAREERNQSRHMTVIFTLGPPSILVDHPDFVRTFIPFTTIPGEVRATLAKGAKLAGQVIRAEDAKPAANIPLFLQQVGDHRGETRIFAGAHTQTDAEGRYQFRSIPGGKFNVCVDDAGPDLTAAALESIEVPAGTRATAPPIRLIKGGIVRGRFIDDATGTTLKRADNEYLDVQIHGPSRPRSGAAVDVAEVARDGTFAIRLPPGMNWLAARTDNSDDAFDVTSGGGYFSVPDGGEINIEFHVRRPERPKPVKAKEDPRRNKLLVKVVNVSNEPLVGTPVVACVLSADGSTFRKIEATTDEEGMAAIDLLGKKCRVLASTPDGLFAGQTVVGADQRELTVKLVPAARISGRILKTSLAPIAERRMLCYLTDTADNESAGVFETKTDIDGTFVFAGVPAGARLRLALVKSDVGQFREGVSFVVKGAGTADLGDLFEEYDFFGSYRGVRHEDGWLPGQAFSRGEYWDAFNAANNEFTKSYSLAAGQNVRHFDKPFPEARNRWVRLNYGPSRMEQLLKSRPGLNVARPKEGPASVAVTVHYHKGRIIRHAATVGDEETVSRSLANVINSVCSIPPSEIQGPQKLLEAPIKGDFVVRLGVPAEELASELEKILWNECNLRVQLNFVDFIRAGESAVRRPNAAQSARILVVE